MRGRDFLRYYRGNSQTRYWALIVILLCGLGSSSKSHNLELESAESEYGEGYYYLYKAPDTEKVSEEATQEDENIDESDSYELSVSDEVSTILSENMYSIQNEVVQE